MKKYIIVLLGLLFFSTNINCQEKKITIKVKDIRNKPIAGAIILFDFEKQETTTNSNGVYKTKLKFVPKEISAFHPKIGIKKISYNGETDLIIQIKNEDEINSANNPPIIVAEHTNHFNNIYDYIRGKVSGVNVSSDGTIRIRGYNSINGNMSPLLILNGVEISRESFSAIRPDDINSITVLKGPETSRYGFRGANGVIIVKTIFN